MGSSFTVAALAGLGKPKADHLSSSGLGNAKLRESKYEMSAGSRDGYLTTSLCLGMATIGKNVVIPKKCASIVKLEHGSRYNIT